MERISREKELFFGALDLAPSERSRYLGVHCSGDDGLRVRVENLLAADMNAGRFLASPTAGLSASFTDGETEFALLQRALAGRFSIEREIGRGGMGVVYLARDVALNRAVAVKLLPTEMADRADYRARFLSEVRTAAGMTHPNIVPIHLVEEQGTVVCFVMSYVEGETLRQLVERTGPISAADAAKMMQEVAWALAHAHERGIVHRDVKPDNILIERASGRALVTDFGIAATLEAGGVMTMDGVFLGTPLFASPEQGTGHGIDRRSDLYSLGATMFYALAGRPVFDAPSATSALERHRSEPPPRVSSMRSDLPRALAECVDRCLAKDRDQRFQSAEDLAKALGAAISAVPEFPEPVRRAAREITQLTADTIGWGLFGLAASSGWVVAKLTSGGFLMDLITVAMQLLVWTGAAVLVVRSAEAVTETREALRKGFTSAHVTRAVSAVTAANPRDVVRYGRSLLAFGVITVVTGIGWSDVWGPVDILRFPEGTWLNFLEETVGLFGPYLIGRLAFRSALMGEIPGSSLARQINISIARIVVHVASWRLRRRTAPDVKVAPTEAILVGSVDALLGQLPTAFRENLSSVPELMRRLEKHAETLRSRRDEIEHALAEAGPREERIGSLASDGSAGGLLRSRMESARAALAETHQNAGARLADVIAALESIRLGLLRLRAGVAVPADLTGDLELAWQVGEQVDALLLGAAEAGSLTNTQRSGAGSLH